MTTLSAMSIWDGLRHPVRSLAKHWPGRHAAGAASSSFDAPQDCPTSERLECIAAYARSGYFDAEYTAGAFVSPVEFPFE